MKLIPTEIEPTMRRFTRCAGLSSIALIVALFQSNERVYAALEKSRYRDNTIVVVVVLWGDHGYEVGEKKIGKLALWEQTTRTPLINQDGIEKVAPQ